MSNRFRNSPDSALLHVATIGRTVALKGDLKLNLFTDFPEQFKKNATFTLDNGSVITIGSYNPERELVHIVGYDTPEAAKTLTNAKLFTSYEDTRARCKLKEGEYFWFDLIGLPIYEEDVLLGTLDEIERIGPQDCLLVKTDSALVSKGLPETFLIPYIDRFVLKADLEARKIIVEGGLDLLEAS